MNRNILLSFNFENIEITQNKGNQQNYWKP